eukprot:Em0010g508a
MAAAGLVLAMGAVRVVVAAARVAAGEVVVGGTGANTGAGGGAGAGSGRCSCFCCWRVVGSSAVVVGAALLLVVGAALLLVVGAALLLVVGAALLWW